MLSWQRWRLRVSQSNCSTQNWVQHNRNFLFTMLLSYGQLIMSVSCVRQCGVWPVTLISTLRLLPSHFSIRPEAVRIFTLVSGGLNTASTPTRISSMMLMSVVGLASLASTLLVGCYATCAASWLSRVVVPTRIDDCCHISGVRPMVRMVMTTVRGQFVYHHSSVGVSPLPPISN